MTIGHEFVGVVDRVGERLSNSPRWFDTRPIYLAALRFVRDYLRRRFAHLQLRAHFLDLRGLLFDRCRETRNRTFQFRDSRLRFEESVEHSLGRRYGPLVSVGVGGHRAYLSIGIGEHKLGGAQVNAPIEDTGDIRVIRKIKSRVVADADEFEFTSNTGLHLCADIDVTFATY